MRRYETIFIADPDLQDEERNALTQRLDELISKQEGTLLKIDDWGQKRLAYEIKKKQRGHYILLDYCGEGALVDEMERLFRIDDKILKYMTVLLEKNIDVEAAKEEIAKAEAEKAKAIKEKAEAAQEVSSAPAENEDTSSQNESASASGTSGESEATPEPENDSTQEDSTAEPNNGEKE